MSASTSRSGSSVVPSASSNALAVISPSETAAAAVLFWVIIVLGFVVGMRRRSSPRCSGRCVRGNKPANLADCYANNDLIQSTLRPCRGGNAGKCADIRWIRYLADARWDGQVSANGIWPSASLKYTKTLPPVDGRVLMLYAVTRQPLTWCGWSGQPRGTRGRGRRRSSGRPCAAAPERHSSGR